MNFSPEEMNECRTQLCNEAQAYDIAVSDVQADALLVHLELVIEKNKVMNLTRIVDTSDAITKHIVDSLLFAKVYESLDAPSGRFLDLGTGAGYPGIPFAVMTGLAGLLIDSVGKKITAVQSFIDAMGLSQQISTKAIRVEDLARSERGQYVCVMARAVAELNVLIEYASPLLAQGGYLLTSKANVTPEEKQNGLYAASLCGMKYVSRETFELPHEAGHREIYVYQRTGKAKMKLPRQTGMAKHKPLISQKK